MSAARLPTLRELADSLDIVQTIGRYVELKKDGREWKALCPFHSEKSPSFTVYTKGRQQFHCFGCGERGDVVDFITTLHNIDTKSPGWVGEVRRLAGAELPAGQAPVPAPRPPEPQPWVPIIPVPDDAGEILAGQWIEIWNPKRDRVSRLKPTTVDAYRQASGGLIGYVLRCDLGDGKKWTPQATFCQGPDGSQRWSLTFFPEPRPLLGLDDLARRPGAPVVVVEGEKARRAAAEICPAYVAVTWPGGAQAVARADWAPLAGRKVLIWPDADAAGLDAARAISERLVPICPAVRALNTDGLESGWDAADALAQGLSGAALKDFISARLVEPRPAVVVPPPEDPPALPDANEPQVDSPFRVLGVNDGHYYSLPTSTLQVHPIPVAQLTSRAHLLHLAPLHWWEERFAKAKGGVDWEAAADAMARWCERVGPFDHRRIRGLGAWWDEGRSVLHAGEYLLVGGERVEIAAMKSRFLYELKPSIEDAVAGGLPATAADAQLLLDACMDLSWENPLDGMLLAGWVALAPVCGALAWRPHLWITGQRGAGKSWVMDQIVRPALGPSAVLVQANSTEAGVRQRLGQDARPVLFDEAEGEDQRDRQRLQSVIELARQASSESSAEIVKGTAAGRGLSFRVRSMFLMGSINVSLTQAADRSRFTVLSLAPPPKGAAGVTKFDAIKERVSRLTPDACAAIRERIYRMVGAIRTNARTFAKAAATELGNQRAGDQLGALLAGAYALSNDGLVTLEDAGNFIRQHRWVEQAEAAHESDERRLLDELLASPARVEADTSEPRQPMYLTRSLGELVEIAAKVTSDELISEHRANQTLGRMGVRVVGDAVLVSTSHSHIRDALSSTPWAGSWHRLLMRLPGAEMDDSARFAGVRQRAVVISTTVALGIR